MYAEFNFENRINLEFLLGKRYPWLGETATSETVTVYIKIISRGGLKMPGSSCT